MATSECKRIEKRIAMTKDKNTDTNTYKVRADYLGKKISFNKKEVILAEDMSQTVIKAMMKKCPKTSQYFHKCKGAAVTGSPISKEDEKGQ